MCSLALPGMTSKADGSSVSLPCGGLNGRGVAGRTGKEAGVFCICVCFGHPFCKSAHCNLSGNTFSSEILQHQSTRSE